MLPWRRVKVARLAGVFGNLSCTNMLAGPVASAISGFINNVIYGLTLSYFNRVCDCSIGIGIAVGVCTPMGGSRRRDEVFVSAIIIAIVSAVVFNAAQRHLLGWSDRYRLG